MWFYKTYGSALIVVYYVPLILLYIFNYQISSYIALLIHIFCFVSKLLSSIYIIEAFEFEEEVFYEVDLLLINLGSASIAY